MKNISVILVLMSVFSTYCEAQITLDNKLAFTSTDSSKHEVYGLSEPNEINNAIRANTAIFDQLAFDSAYFNGDTLVAVTQIASPALVKGTWVNVLPDAENTGSTYLMLNAFSPVEIRYKNNSLRDGQITTGIVVTLMFDGTYFQLIHTANSGCPVGYVSVNNDYCIEQDEHAANYFWNATNYCYNRQARLCTWSEWHNACVMDATLGLSNMRLNFEFLDDAGDHEKNVSVIGSGGNCNTMNNVATDILTAPYMRNFRCCYSK